MTPEREAQMREMFRKFAAETPNRRAIESLAYRQDVALFVWLACARALEPSLDEKDAQINQLRAELSQWRFRAKDAESYIDEVGM